jgi:hypothetical protein
VQKSNHQISNPYIRENPNLYNEGGLTSDHNTTSKKQIAYINITGDARPVGPIGLKKAEKDLIMRRYKYNH